VVTHPAAAAVSVDGELVGKSPLTLSLAAGTHEIVVTRDRYATITQSVELPAKLDLMLKRPTATCTSTASRGAARSFVRGQMPPRQDGRST